MFIVTEDYRTFNHKLRMGGGGTVNFFVVHFTNSRSVKIRIPLYGDEKGVK